MKPSHILISALAVIAGTGCFFHHAPDPENDPAAITAMRPEFRLVNRETTWVARGTGYELVGRTQGDLVLAHRSLELASDAMRRVFPNDSLPTIVAVVRRIPGEGQSFLPRAPVPPSNTHPIVEMVIPDPKARRDDADDRGWMRVYGSQDPALPAIHTWISARAKQLNPRVPSWSGEMIDALERDSLTNQSAAILASHSDALIPLSQFFTMEAPLPDNPVTRGGRGVPAIPGAGVPGGGMGGRGGGGGGRGGRGGSSGRGGGGGRGGEGERAAATPLGASAAYDAEARVLGRYLKREGYDFIGALIDTQMAGHPIDEAFVKKQMTVAQAETDWRLWLNGLAAAVSHH